MSRAAYRLCFVNSMRTWGGSEVWMLETARVLRDRGHDISLITNRHSDLHKRATAAGLRVFPASIRVDNAPWTILHLAYILRQNRITALIANRTKDVTIAAPAGRLAGVDHILATRESDFPLKNRLDYRWRFQVFCTGLLVNSRATERTIMDSLPGLNPARVHLLYKGIDVDRFYPGPPVAGPPIVGMVGQLIPRKGLAEVMQAWTQIDRTPYVERPVLRLAGEGVMRSELNCWRDGLLHPGKVEILGYTEDIVAFYHGLSLLVMPSHAEGFGLAAAEALACGIPVIAGDASSLPEIVIDGQTGILVPPGQSEPLHTAMKRLLDEPSLRRRYGQAGRRLIVEQYPRNKTLDRLLCLTGHPDYPADINSTRSDSSPWAPPQPPRPKP